MNLENLAARVVAETVDTFYNIDKLALPDLIKDNVRRIRKHIEIQSDQILETLGEIDWKLIRTECDANIETIPVSYQFFEYCGEKRFCTYCAKELYAKQGSTRIKFIEFGVWYSYEYRYGAGKKLVQKEITTHASCEDIDEVIEAPDSYCDNCMGSLYEITIDPICRCPPPSPSTSEDSTLYRMEH